MTIDNKSARDALKFEILLILFAVRFTTFWHRHRIMTHFWPPAVHTHTHTHTRGTTDRTTNLLISSSVHYVHLGGDNEGMHE